MPRLSSWFVRASFIYLALGFSLGALLLANKGLFFYPPIWKFLPAHEEILLMGWFVQLAVGVAYWILPRLPGTSPRGNETLAWLSFWLINFGMVMIIAEAFISWPWLILGARLVELTGVTVFVIASWTRVKAFGK